MITNRIVIHDLSRTDRFQTLTKELESFFNTSTINIQPAIFDKPNYVGIAKAHLNCVAYAKENRLDSILIMEDDVHFISKKARSYYEECLDNLPEDWDVLLGGISGANTITKYNDHWSKVYDHTGLHFYVVNKKAYERILNFDFSDHIDRAMSTTLGLNCYVSNKIFAIQHKGYSDQKKSYVDYDELWNKFELLK